MAKSFDIRLNSKLKQFCKKNGIDFNSIDEKKLYEKFSNYTIVSNLIKDDSFDINKISTGFSKGIDGIAIIVNDKVISEENDLETIGDNENIVIKICFIQATAASSFDYQKFEAFNDTVVSFLTGSFRIEPFSDIIEKLFDEEGKFIDNISETPIIDIYFSSGKTNHTVKSEEIENEKRKIDKRADFKFNFNLNKLEVLQLDEIIPLFDNVDSFLEIEIKFEQEIQLDDKDKISMSLLSTLKFEEYKKIILNGESLRERLFVENVRSKVNDSTVNKDILKTLEDDANRPYFVYFNNGITILCKEIKRHPSKKNVCTLTYPRVINGCQTSHMLYEHYLIKPEDLNDIGIVVKVIATENPDLKKKIILATNNQNSIDKDLESLNEFHSKLEEFFIGISKIGIYYERLRGQYSDILPAYKVLNKETIAKSYVSIFLQLPHEMKSNALSKIEKFKHRKQLFDTYDNDTLKRYYLSGILFFYLNKFLTSTEIELKSQTQDMHLLLACIILLNKKYSTIDEIIEALSLANNALDIFKIANTEIESKTYLYEARGFYSGPKTKKLILELQNVTYTTTN